MRKEAKPPLEGVRVLDLTRLLPGPYCTMILGDLGSDVIKVEEPKVGDYSRTLTPLLKQVGYWYLLFNRNKRSIALNMKTERGRKVFHRLVETADVVVESFRPGVTTRLGADYETLRKIKPSIIYCSITGYGQSGPYKSWVAHDINYLGVGGLLSVTGEAEGRPTVPGYPIADLSGGMLAALGILVALRQRDVNGGEGAYLDISMSDVIASWSSTAAAEYFTTGKATTRGQGVASGSYPNYRVYETKDGKYITLGATEEHFWSDLCRKLNDYELERLLRTGSRRKALRRLEKIFKTRNRDEWVKYLDPSQVPVAPVLDIAEMLRDEHMRARGLFWTMRVPQMGKVRQIGVPLRFGHPKRTTLPPPSLGQHTRELLKELGYTGAEIDSLARDS